MKCGKFPNFSSRIVWTWQTFVRDFSLIINMVDVTTLVSLLYYIICNFVCAFCGRSFIEPEYYFGFGIYLLQMQIYCCGGANCSWTGITLRGCVSLYEFHIKHNSNETFRSQWKLETMFCNNFSHHNVLNNFSTIPYLIFIIKPTRCTNFSVFFGIKLYMFRTVCLSFIRSFPLFTQQWYMSYRFADSLRAGSGRDCSSVLILLASCQHKYHCWVYSVKLLMMDRETVRNM